MQDNQSSDLFTHLSNTLN